MSEIQFGGASTQNGHEFIVEELNNLLAWRDLEQHFFAESLYLDCLDQITGNIEVHIRLQQREPDIAHGLGDVRFGDFAEAAQLLERAFEFVGQLGKHG